MEDIIVGTYGWGYFRRFFDNDNFSMSVVTIFGGKKTGFMFHKVNTHAFLLISGKSTLYHYDPGEKWFDKIDYNQTMAANWHDLSTKEELVKNAYFSIAPGVVYQLEATEDCQFVHSGERMEEPDTYELFKGD